MWEVELVFSGISFLLNGSSELLGIKYEVLSLRF